MVFCALAFRQKKQKERAEGTARGGMLLELSGNAHTTVRGERSTTRGGSWFLCFNFFVERSARQCRIISAFRIP